MEGKTFDQKFLEHAKIASEMYAKLKENEKHISIKSGFVHPTPNVNKNNSQKNKENDLTTNNKQGYFAPKCNRFIEIKFEV